MTKENALFLLIGLLGGAIVGFMFANSVNQKGSVPVSASAVPNANMPAGHPPIPGGSSQVEIQAAIDKAKNEPGNFDAQLKAAEFYYQIQRFDSAIEFLKRANELKPQERAVLVHLGNAYFDSENYAEAEKWYASALKAKEDDPGVRTDLGLTFLLREKPDYDRAIQEFKRSLSMDANHVQSLQNLTVAYIRKGDAQKAKETIGTLESLDPTNESLAKLKEDIQKLPGA